MIHYYYYQSKRVLVRICETDVDFCVLVYTYMVYGLTSDTYHETAKSGNYKASKELHQEFLCKLDKQTS